MENKEIIEEKDKKEDSSKEKVVENTKKEIKETIIQKWWKSPYNMNNMIWMKFF